MIHEHDYVEDGTANEQAPERQHHLDWNATRHAWVASTAQGTRIFVDEQTYERHLHAYLESQGMQVKTWWEIMRSAEAEWQKQCEATAAFQADLDVWLTSNEPGVSITSRHPAEHISLR